LGCFVSKQPPTDHERVKKIDVTAGFEKLAVEDPYFIHIKAFNLPPQEKQLVINTAGIIRLGELLAESFLENR
ncbi:MAG: hypothetical protein ACI91J_000912, partial [Yoonia sp.]